MLVVFGLVGLAAGCAGEDPNLGYVRNTQYLCAGGFGSCADVKEAVRHALAEGHPAGDVAAALEGGFEEATGRAPDPGYAMNYVEVVR